MTNQKSEATTKPLNFWDDKFWHHLVHQRLGERLFYYLIRVRPFDLIEVENSLKNIMQANRVGSVRVFPVFGTYDLIIRAWLYPSVADRFRKELDISLANIGGSRVVHTFAVEHIDQRWHRKEDVDKALLESLDESLISEIQAGQNLQKYRELETANLAFQRRKTDSIRFFVAINIESLVDALPIGVVNAIKHDLNTTHSHEIKNVSIYRGFGFCQILVKGEVQSYYSIAPLPNWIGAAYKLYGAHTETYLVHSPSPLLGDESIGEATFLALGGRDLFVQSVIPELYDQPSKKQRLLERFLTDEVQKYVPSIKDKRLLHDYLFSFLNEDGSGMAKTLLIFFHDLESYLSKSHKTFISSITGSPVAEIYKRANLNGEALKRPTLRHMFLVTALALKTERNAKTENRGDLTDSWDELVNLRNEIIHGKADHLKDWNNLLRHLIPHLPRIRELLRLMENTTATTCGGDYL